MTIEQFLGPVDARRASGTLRKLAAHDISCWALTGGLAIEMHCLRRGFPSSIRPLNDLDFIADSFDCVPGTLAPEFLFRHVHPGEPPGKSMLQFIDPDTRLRVDLFRAYGAIMSRAIPVEFPSGSIPFLRKSEGTSPPDQTGRLSSVVAATEGSHRLLPRRSASTSPPDQTGRLSSVVAATEGSLRLLISLEDAVARAARLMMDLAGGVPVLQKHAVDYLRLAAMVQPSEVEAAWRDHRKPMHPATFRETKAVLDRLIPAHPDLLIAPEYSRDTGTICPRCVPTAPFALADANKVLSLIGYC